MIAIINYGVGNLKSILKAIEFVGEKAVITDNTKDLLNADAIVFPGVGAFKTAIQKLRSMKDVIDSLSLPILGICLGMQLFATRSTEGGIYDGLNYIPGEVVKLPEYAGKIPHIGWNTISFCKYSEILDSIEEGSYVYFVHSYYLKTDKKFVTTETEYGIKFTSGVEKDNYYGFQFHPEKSGEVGLKIIENFIKIAKR